MQSTYRHTTPFYDLTLLTSPARIESLAVDPSGRGEHVGVVNNFGRLGTTLFASFGSFGDIEANAVVAGRPAHVAISDNRLRLEKLPFGDHRLYATWTFEFRESTFDMSVDWHLDRPLTDLWELGWKLDSTTKRIGDLHEADRANADLGEYLNAERACLMWWDEDPRYAQTLVAALISGTADRGDMIRVEIPHDRPTTSGIWCTVAVEGGTHLEPGDLHSGKWRFGASERPADTAYATALTSDVETGTSLRSAKRQPVRHQPVAAELGARLPTSPPQRPVHEGPDRSWLLSDGNVLAAFVPTEDRWDCALYVRNDAGWQLAAAPAAHVCFTTVTATDSSLTVQAELSANDKVQTTSEQVWSIRTDGDKSDNGLDGARASGAIHVHATDTPSAGHTTHPMHEFLAYPGGRRKREIDRYDVLSSPVLRPQPDLVVGQRALWSPSVHVQHGPDSIALIPDLRIHEEPAHHAAMPPKGYFGLTVDLDVATRLADGPVLGIGWRSVEGVFGYYFRDTVSTPSEQTVVAYDLVLRSGAPSHSVTSDVQRRLWADVGRAHFNASLLPQTQPADSAFDETWSYWQDHYDSREVDGREVGAVRVDRALEPGLNFMSWFNALRSSYGLFTYGRDRAELDLVAKAESTLELLLSAPRESGAFPTIANLSDHGVEWQASHRNFLNQMPWGPTAYHTFDMGWAAYWLLRWHQDLRPEPRAVEFATSYGEFLVNNQLPSGAVPSWFRMATLEADPHLYESAQTSASMMLLAELARVTGRADFLNTAQIAGRYLVQHHLGRDRWDDFEPYYSNTLKAEGASDPFSGQHTQNTLSMHFAAVGFLTMFDLTGDHLWLDAGVRAVDSFLRYQYVTPGLGLSMNCFGGFAVQNTDNEALDARQSQFGVTLLDYARATGRSDYAERGIAALRAGYATMASPSAAALNPKYFDAHPTGRGPENYAHATFDAPAEYTMFDWGQGSAAAGFAEARNRFGDVWIDASAGHAYGIDYVVVDDFRLDESGLALELSSPAKGHQVLLKVHGLRSPQLVVRVNDKPERTYSRAELTVGIVVTSIERGA